MVYMKARSLFKYSVFIICLLVVVGQNLFNKSNFMKTKVSTYGKMEEQFKNKARPVLLHCFRTTG